MPPSSLYCCHASVSRISAAARNRRMAASPGVRPPLRSAARAADPSASSRPAAIVPAPSASPPSTKERRLVRGANCSVVSMISSFWNSASKQGTTDAHERGDAFPRGRARQGLRRLGERGFAGGHRYRFYAIHDRPDLARQSFWLRAALYVFDRLFLVAAAL